MDLKDFENISGKIDALFSVLPIISKLISAVQFIAPNAAGVAKANFVIKTIISLQPELLGTEKALYTIISEFVNVFKSSGQIVRDSSSPAPKEQVAAKTPIPSILTNTN